MTGGNGEFLDVRLCSDDIPERERIPYVREVYGRAILRHEIEPCRDSRFYWRSALRSMAGLGLATSVVSAVRTYRTSEQIDSDDLVLNATVTQFRLLLRGTCTTLASTFQGTLNPAPAPVNGPGPGGEL